MATVRDMLLNSGLAVPVTVGSSTGYVRPLTIAEGQDLQRRVLEVPEPIRETAAAVWLVVYSACDAEGQRIFDADDFERVKALPAFVIAPLAEAATKANHLTVAEAKKN